MTPSSDTRLPYWRSLFDKAIYKPEKEGLAARLDEVEAAIFSRLQELSQLGTKGNEVEFADIRDACTVLKGLRRDLLDFPDWDDGEAGDDR